MYGIVINITSAVLRARSTRNCGWATSLEGAASYTVVIGILHIFAKNRVENIKIFRSYCKIDADDAKMHFLAHY